jgi:CspA family cold shock protein
VFFKSSLGWGFLRSAIDGQDYFVHYSAIEQSGFKNLYAGDEVSFDVEMGPKGKPQATRVVVTRKARVA